MNQYEKVFFSFLGNDYIDNFIVVKYIAMNWQEKKDIKVFKIKYENSRRKKTNKIRQKKGKGEYSGQLILIASIAADLSGKILKK
jgi:hypothetical protein